MQNCNVTNMRTYIRELREGGREQTSGTLAVRARGANWKFCCLGVACECAIADGLKLDVKDQGTSVVQRSYGIYKPNPSSEVPGSFYGSSADLPPEVQTWLGVDSENPHLQVAPTTLAWLRHQYADMSFSVDRKLSAINLNDDYKVPFPLIADCFEYTYLREDWDARNAG